MPEHQRVNYITGELFSKIVTMAHPDKIVDLIPDFDFNYGILLSTPLYVPQPTPSAPEVNQPATQSSHKHDTDEMTTPSLSLNPLVANITPTNTSSTTDALQQPTFIKPVEKIQADKKTTAAGASKQFVSTSLPKGEDEEWESHFSTGKWYNKENEPYYKLLALCSDDDDDDESEFENQLRELGIDLKFKDRRNSTPEPMGETRQPKIDDNDQIDREAENCLDCGLTNGNRKEEAAKSATVSRDQYQEKIGSDHLGGEETTIDPPKDFVAETGEQIGFYMNPMDKIWYLGAPDEHGRFYAVNRDCLIIAEDMPTLLTGDFVPNGIRIVPVSDVIPVPTLRSGTEYVVDEDRVLSKRVVTFQNATISFAQDAGSIIEGYISHKRENIITVEKKPKIRKFSGFRGIITKFKSKTARHIIPTKSILRKVQHETGLRRCNSCILLDCQELDGDGERPKILARVNRPSTS
ncbi:hypothetical protein I9W82_000415 [Candida metapsilosis]|uniref:Uncharacterized protein n=1 Tax=Candida metapsilosis TaxID=273372 RepID=A0A8H8DDU2_9ASCO|nr:hypothetical protein I9W82_000415 [Candida metapsilosis]